jgi:transcription antitermination factor NusB
MSFATLRREARERALGLLYEAEAKGCSGADVLASLPVPPDEFAEALVRAVDDHRERIDGYLEQYAEGWTLARMAAIDRAALRMGTAELLTRADVPTGVVLAETVDLASRFSTDGSGRFVNGLLARVAREVRPGTETVSGNGSGHEDEPGQPLVDGVIIDLDGVIRHWDAQHLADHETRLGLPAGAIGEAAFDADRLARAMDGRLPFEGWAAEIGEAVERAHGVPADDVADAWAMAGWDIDLVVVELLAAVRATVPVVLLSNASTRLRIDLEASEIEDAFDAIVGSADIGVTKPAAAAFRHAADAIGVDPARCCFIDDLLVNVEGARALGMRAEVFEGPEALRALFGELGLL